MLGLPDGITACLFDLDGVLTKTAEVHARAWKQTFDPFLKGSGEKPFDRVRDYDEYVDGKPRLDGVRDFLASRAIELPEGSPGDPPDAQPGHVLVRATAVAASRAPGLRPHAARPAPARGDRPGRGALRARRRRAARPAPRRDVVHAARGRPQAFPWQAPKPGPAPEQPAHRAPSRRRPRGSG
jgi:hypothetical protein